MLMTKLMPPRSARRLVERPRLTRSVELGRSKVTLVRAPAGFGKTSLLAQWYGVLRNRGQRAGWLSFDAGDRDAHEVLMYVVRAFESAGQSFSSSVHELLRNEFASVDAIVVGIVNDLCREAEPLYLFLDDVHVLRVATVSGALAAFLERMPGNVHLALASREALPFPLARARAFGNVLEITASDLRFSKDETAEFMAVGTSARLDDAGLTVLEGRVEGWIAGLQLAAIALENDANPNELLERISGRRWTYAEFFVEVVISQQSPDLRDFLLATSLLDRFSPALCDAVLESSASRAFLDEIESRGLFIFSLDGERRWYRYHHLFAEFLREEFASRYPQRPREIHARASRWFAAAGLPQDAFAHAIKAKDVVQAARILNERCHTMFYDGRLSALLDSASQIPENVLAEFPRIRLAKAWSLVLQWEFSEAGAILDAVGTRLSERRGGDESTREAMLHLHCTMMLAQFKDDMPTVERQCATLLECFMDADAYLVGNYFTSLLYAERERFELRNVDRLDARARDYYKVTGSRFVLVWHQSIAGPTRFLAGDTAAAIEALRDGLDAATATGGPDSPLASIPALLLAEVHYERNDLDAASELLERYLPLASELGFVDQLVAGYLTSSRLQRLRGDERGSDLTLQRGLDVGSERGFHRLTANVVAEWTTQLVRAGRFDRAADLAAAHDLLGGAAAMLPGEGSTTASAARAVAWAALALAHGRTGDALLVAKAWQRFTGQAGAVRAQVRWGTIVAQILQAKGDARGAERAILQAVTAATAGRFIRTFLDLGSALPVLLGNCFAACSDPLTPVEKFGRELLASAARTRGARTESVREAPDRAPGAGALNVREVEIVKLVASGLSNRGIAQRLAMTEGTVKWYLHRAYDKVGARNRTQVVELARRSGLLP